MPDLALVTQDTGHASAAATKAMLERKGHAVTLYQEDAVTGSTLLGVDAILCNRVSVGKTALAGYLAGYMADHAIPVLAGMVAGVSGDITDDIATLLGMIGGVGAEADVAADAASLPSPAVAHPVTGGLDPALPIFLRAAPDFAAHVTGGMATAGREILLDQNGRVVMSLCDPAGQYGRRLDTLEFFGARCGFIGWLYGRLDYGKEGAALIDAAVRWATGTSGAGYPTGRSATAATRAFDLSALGAVAASRLEWIETVPGAGGSVALDASLDDGASWSEVASSGDAVPGLSPATPTDGLAVRLRATLTTDTAAETPTLDGLVLTVEGEGSALRQLPGAPASAAPTGWLDGGLLTWVSGANQGLAMEVKSWDAATRQLSLFLPMPYAIAAGDRFTVYPGCDKRLATCRDKFANVLNFRGEPYVPGNDALIRGAQEG